MPKPRKKRLWTKHIKKNFLVKPVLFFLRNFYYDNIRKFTNNIVIETTTVCTRKCIYCPHAWIKREAKFMEEALYKKIIDDLAEIKFNGGIDLVPDGEAITDKRLPSLIAYTKRKLPKCTIEVMSNGDLLTKKIFDKLIAAGADRFNVSRHLSLKDGKYVIAEPKAAVETYRQLNKEEKKKFLLFFQDNLRRADEKDNLFMFHNRCGYIPLERTIHKEEFRGPGCLSPTNYIHFNYKGDVLLCCRQWSGSENPTFGNVKDKHIKDIWNDPRYKRVRRRIRSAKYDLSVCKNCLFGHLPDPKKMQQVWDEQSKNKQ